MTKLDISLFGPPRFEVDGQQVEIGRRKSVALFSYLAVTRQRHSRSALATMLWPEVTESRSRASLRSALWSINSTSLEAWLQIDAEKISLMDIPDVTLDTARFRKLLAAEKAHDHSDSELCKSCQEALAEAVTLYQDDFMAGFSLPDAPEFDEWQFYQADGLRGSLASTLAELIAFHAARHEFDRAIDYSRRWISLEPLHEPAHRALMQFCARSGQKTAALRQYQIYEERLAAEMGLEPSEELTALRERIRSGRWPGPEFRRERALDSVVEEEIPTNLPSPVTRLIGRQTEVERVLALLQDQKKRLITIAGPGGIGKTRLALEVGRKAASSSDSTFPDGVFFIPLAPVDEPEAMLSLIAETVGYPLQGDKRSAAQQLFDYFRNKSSLLVLDNFDHLLSGASFIGELLQQAPGLKVLATSRERLNLYKEQLYVLQGLPYPERRRHSEASEYPAAALFLQSARRIRPDYSVAGEDLGNLAEICRLVEGMPLALELAAAWADMMSLAEIAAEIRDNLDFLATDLRDIPDRHRSMRAVFESSWENLKERERSVYAQLSVFPGGFDLEAAATVAGASRKMLAGLVKQSLLHTSDEVGRFEMHELLRQYAAAKLKRMPERDERARDRHAAYYCAYLEQRHVDLKGARQHQGLAEIEREVENAHAAWQWAADHGQLLQLRQALVPLAHFYQWNGRFHEGEMICRIGLDALSESPPGDQALGDTQLTLKLHTWQSLFELSSAKYEEAGDSLRRAQGILENLELAGKDAAADAAFLLLLQSEAAKLKAFSGEALELNEQSLELYRSIGDDWGVTLALDALGVKHQTLGNYDLAVQIQEECLTIRQRLEDRRGIAKSYSLLGHYILFAGDIESSERYLQKSLSLFREVGTVADLRGPLLILGINLLFGGKFERSIESFQECWKIHKELGMPHEPGAASVGIARARINLGLYGEARDQSEADLARYRSLGHKWYIAFAQFNLGRIELVEGNIDMALERLQESTDLLLEMDDRPLVPDVLFCLALTHRLRNDREQVIRTLHQALKIAMENRPLSPMRFELVVMALLALDGGELARAVEFLAAARQSPYIANSVWFAEIAGEEIEAAAEKLGPEGLSNSERRGQERDLWGTAEELLLELTSAAP